MATQIEIAAENVLNNFVLDLIEACTDEREYDPELNMVIPPSRAAVEVLNSDITPACILADLYRLFGLEPLEEVKWALGDVPMPRGSGIKVKGHPLREHLEPLPPAA